VSSLLSLLENVNSLQNKQNTLHTFTDYYMRDTKDEGTTVCGSTVL